LAAVEGDAAQVVREADAGLICEPGNPIALADAVRCFAAFLSVKEKSSVKMRGEQRAIVTIGNG